MGFVHFQLGQNNRCIPFLIDPYTKFGCYLLILSFAIRYVEIFKDSTLDLFLKRFARDVDSGVYQISIFL